MALQSETLPNLKIQVENDYREDAMDVDEERIEESKAGSVGEAEESELEEGEISDSKDDDDPVDNSRSQFKKGQILEFEQRRYENKSGAFVTGIDIFSKEGQEKLNERAKRFGLDPTKVRPLTEPQLQQLYVSLDLNESESSLEKQGYRLDALHIRGTEDMSTQDVFDYFKDYGPASIEWINDVCCNVVWLDKTSPARALLGLTKPISGLPKGGKKDSEKLEEVILVQEEDGEAEVEDMGEEAVTEPAAMPLEEAQSSSKQDEKEEKPSDADDEYIRSADIEVPVPPGMWRLGAPCSKARCILLRFATRADRKPKQAEKMSEYYKKYGNPNYGGIRGIISTSRKRKYQSDRYSQHPMPDLGDEGLEGNKNPWGSLAQNWGTMDRSHYMPGFFDPDDPLLLDKPALPNRPIELRTILRSNRSNPPPPPPTLHSSASDSEQNSSDSEDSVDRWCKRLRGPHMKMYADEEEAKIQKRRKLSSQSTKKTVLTAPSKVDLRSRLLSRNAKPKTTKASVWTRLEAVKVQREVDLAGSSEHEWSTEDEEGPVKTTVRSEVCDLRHALKSRKSEKNDDLRSRLNKKDTRKKDKSASPSTPAYEKSPLRIEINNDEYCGDSNSSSGSSGSSSGSESSSSSGSSSESSSSDSEVEAEEEAEKSS